MVLEKPLDHLLRDVFKAGNDLFMHCFRSSYCDDFFFPRYLKGSSDNYEHVETHMINKGIRVGMEVTRKQNLGTNTEQTMGTTKQAEWNCWEKSWVGFFAVNVRKSYRSFTWKPNNTWSWGALIIATCPWHFSRANSCLGVLEDSGLLVRHRVLLILK